MFGCREAWAWGWGDGRRDRSVASEGGRNKIEGMDCGCGIFIICFNYM